MIDSTFYSEAIENSFGSDISVKNISPVGGGCINQTSKITTNLGPYFIKVNAVDQLNLFQKEKRGLEILKEKSTLGVPNIYGVGSSGSGSYLILEWIEKGVANTDFWHQFGRQLGIQHKESSSQFGLEHDNHIGRLPQSNRFHQSWSEFFVQERLEPQLAVAERSGMIGKTVRNQFSILYKKLNHLIPKEHSSLLHGDLWSGNFLCGSTSSPYIFDPAVYYGHRETELAFTTMFGGFDHNFYSAYSEEFPLEPGFDERIEIHNLYPLLVHVNLFGQSYLSGILNTLKRHI